MKTNRRGFLGLFGAGAVAAPSMAKISMHETLNNPVGLGFSNVMPQEPQEAFLAGPSKTAKDWAKTSLKELLGKSKDQRYRERMRHTPYQWDVNVVALRSISIPTRYRMSRDRAYERSLYKDRVHFEGVINGWW